MSTLEEEITVVEVTVNPPPPAKEADPVEPPNPVLARLLRMADGYRRAGAPNQAIEMYFELVERNGDTPEGKKAHESLMGLCDEYEQAGKLRQARALYERLL